MAETYASFQGKEPNIDVNLFVNASSQGIAAGNAQKSTAGAIFAGGTSAIETGLDVATKVENLKQEQAKTQIDTDEAVIAARKKQIQAEADKTAAEAEDAASANGQLSKKMEAQARLKANEQKYNDLTNIDAVGTALDDPNTSPEQLTELLKRSTGTFTRNPDEGLAALTRARSRIDPGFYDEFKNTITAADQEKRRTNMLENQAEAARKEIEKNKSEYDEALTGLSSLPGLHDAMQQPGYDYRAPKIYPAQGVTIQDGKLVTQNGQVVRNTLSAGEDKSYIMAVGDNVVESYLTPDEARQAQKWLNKYKQYGTANKWPTPAQRSLENNVTDTTDLLAPSGLARPAPVAGAKPINQNIVDAAKARNDNAFAQAQSNGYGGSYEALIVKGNNIARKAMVAPDYIKTPQTVPVTPGAPAITKLTPITDEGVDTPLGSVAYGAQHLSQVLGGANVTLYTTVHKPQATKRVIDRINNIPVLKDKPALIKGLVAVESAGNPNARSAAGAAGLMQFMSPAAQDMNITDDERYDPNKAVPAGIKYLETQYDSIEKKLKSALGAQGTSIVPDPRMVLAAYNGGQRDILRGIRAGKTTWEGMSEYLKSVKSPGAYKENVSYADKVIVSSIPFIKGGNASDDSWVKTLINFGIIDVG